MATTDELDDTLSFRINSKEKQKFIQDKEKQHAHVLRKFIKNQNDKTRKTIKGEK